MTKFTEQKIATTTTAHDIKAKVITSLSSKSNAVKTVCIASAILCATLLLRTVFLQSDAEVALTSEQDTSEALASNTAEPEKATNPIVQSKTIKLEKPEPVIDVMAKVESDSTDVDDELLNQFLEELDTEPTPDEKMANSLDSLRKNIASDNVNLQDRHPVQGPNDNYSALRIQLSTALQDKPELLQDLIDIFVEDPDSLLGREISAVLAETGAEEVQTAALDIALNDTNYDHGQRTAALFTVAEMDSISGDTRDRLVNNLSVESDTELLQFSLIALRPAPGTQEDSTRVHTALASTIQNDDEHVRRHAAYQMAEWATSDNDLAPLRVMALEEPDVNARARAIMSIGESSFRSPENKAVLWAVVNNNSEPGPVRQAAWKSLRDYPLTQSELSTFNNTGEQIKQEAIDLGN